MRDIKNYEGLYAVTSCGRVWSYKSNQFLTNSLNHTGPYGYSCVYLYKDSKRKKHFIHRLVAEAYIDNPSGLPEVNHIDENKSHNYLSNLEFCTKKYNNNYGTRNQRIAEYQLERVR